MRRGGLLLALLVAACSNAPASFGDAFRRGEAALAEGDARTARIELLNAIKADPRNRAARILQARTYLALGDGVAAQAEIERARALGVARTETRPLMAHALLLQDRGDEALEELNGASGAYAERMRGRALAETGDRAAAAAAFDAALALAPQDAGLWTDIARFRRSGGEMAGALQAADRAVAANRRSVEAITLRGELTRSQYGLRAALPWFDRAIEIDDDDVTARLERAITLGDMGAAQAMLAETRNILSLSSNEPMAFYLQAMLAARAHNFTLARSLYQRTHGKLDDQPATMLLAAAIDLQTGNPDQAVSRLKNLVEIQPDNLKARWLLAAGQWRTGDAAAVVATLRPLADRPDADTYSLALIGHALARLGNASAASAYLTRAAQPQTRGSGVLGPPADPVRLATLRAEAAAAPDDASAQVDLIRGLLSAGLGDEALERARALQSRNPGAPDSHLLVGDALGIQGRFAEAADQYRKAANIAFTEPTAMRMIEALQYSGQNEAAGKVLTLFLEQNPRNVSALLLVAGGYIEARQWSGAIAIYEDLRRRLGDRDAVMLNNLAWAYSELGEIERALPLAKKAWLLDRGNPATADTLGWLLFKSGKDKAQGLALLESAARAAPANAQIRNHLDGARGS
ncbi:MAG: tetratricopeptide repeat protein [Alphaproteobacteria bacterium]|nr:tetratricopeptide repeat protein [Alphaproteobacteria bacterium]